MFAIAFAEIGGKSKHLGRLFLVFLTPHSNFLNRFHDHDGISTAHSRRALKHLLKAVLAVRIRLLKVILLLIQIRHLLVQSLTLLLEPLLHIWNRRADEPIHIKSVSAFHLIPLPPPQSRGANSDTCNLHLADTLIHLCLCRQRRNFRGSELQHTPLSRPGGFLLFDNDELLFGEGLLLADFL